MWTSWPNRVLAVLLAAGIVAAFLTVGSPATTATRARDVSVSTGVVQSTVSATGNLQAPENVSVNFQTSGVLESIDVQPGQKVGVGQLLGTINSPSASSAVASAQAALASAQANLYQTENPLSATDLNQSNVSATSSELSVTTAEHGVTQAKQSQAEDAKTQALSVSQAKQSEAYAEQASALDESTLAQAITTANTQLSTDTQQLASDKTQLASDQAQQSSDQSALTTAQQKQTGDGCTSTATTATCIADQVGVTSAQTKVTQDGSAVAGDETKVETTDPGKISQDQTSVTNAQNAQASGELKDKQSISQAQNSTANAKQSQAGAALKDQQSVTSAQTQLQTAQSQLQSTLAANAVKAEPPKIGTLTQAETSVEDAKLNLATANQTLGYTRLVAPVAGTISAVNGTVGLTVGSSGGSSSSSSGSGSSGSSSSSSGASSTGSSSTSSNSSSSSSSSDFATITDVSGMQMSAAFSETDATKLRVGQSATVSVDALPNEELSATLIQISPVGESSSGAVTYTALFQLNQSEAGLRPGMSASVSVVVQQVFDAINVPSAALSGSTVDVVKNGKATSTSVVVGVRGDSSVQILSGLSAGEEVQIAAPTFSATTSSSSSTAGSLTSGTGTGAATRAFGGGGGGFGGGGGGFGGG